MCPPQQDRKTGSSLAPSALAGLPQPGDVLADKFLIESVLGEGGMCFVFAARHLQLDGHVAIKILRPDVLAEASNPDEIVERFLREGRAASQIRNEHVVRTFDVGTLPEGGTFLVMEHLEGRDLDALLREHGPLPVEAAVDYVLQAGEAIAEAHARGIIHRDLKPANLFLTTHSDGSPFVKVLDFGISKIIRKRNRFDPALTGTANVVGTPHYMSPEQLKGSRDVDVRTDIWSLGAILHELLSGEPPFKGTTMPEICANILKEQPTALAPLRPEVPGALQAVVLRCLEKDLSRRFVSIAELASALAEFSTPAGRASAMRIAGISRSQSSADGGFVIAQPPPAAPWGSTDPSWGEQKQSPARQRRSAVTVFFGLVMAATVTLLGLAWNAKNRPDLTQISEMISRPSPAALPPEPPTLTQGEVTSGAAVAPSTTATEASAVARGLTPLAVPTATTTASSAPRAPAAAATAREVTSPRPKARPASRAAQRPARPVETDSPATIQPDESLFEERK